MTVGGWPVPAAPGIPLRSRFARPRPPYADAKGDGVDFCLRRWWRPGSLPRPVPAPGIPREHRFARSRPFRWERKGRGVSARSAHLDSRLRGNDEVGGGVIGYARPPRAYPCGLAPLARVPLTLTRRGTVRPLRRWLSPVLRGGVRCGGCGFGLGVGFGRLWVRFVLGRILRRSRSFRIRSRRRRIRVGWR